MPGVQDSPTQSQAGESNDERLGALLRQFWGFDTLRPLQREAIDSAIQGRDSLVVMPTGGGKSLCYQVPPLLSESMDIVVSPLISLMKDQVDGLRANGYPAAALHSGIDADERREVESKLRDGSLRLLFASPERLVQGYFQDVISQANVRRFSIDEAHCISQWGHDFRPEYRQLALVRDRFPRASMHAFTATATPRVREDIVRQLGLRDPAVLVGVFDRPNLTYRITPKASTARQVQQIITRHKHEAVIVYCLSRKDTEKLAAQLSEQGIEARAYHAGMGDTARHRVQEYFSTERLNVVVATVAFGMGIDRSNVRCVIHATMPKSIEAYQQETGRAGRDGLPAECVLLYSSADAMRWESLIERSSQEAESPKQQIDAQVTLLRAMQTVCGSAVCRHRALSEYFGQSYEPDSCEACDICLGEATFADDATVIAQKALSCIARTGQRFGIGHIVDVLRGADTDQIRRCGHDQLSTHGLLAEIDGTLLKNYIYQLVDQGFITRSAGDRPTLSLNEASMQVLRNQREVRLLKPRIRGTTRRAEMVTSEADQGLFEHLRAWRKRVADERAAPPYTIFNDRTLAELAAHRPRTIAQLGLIHGIGQRKLDDFGDELTGVIGTFVDETASN